MKQHQKHGQLADCKTASSRELKDALDAINCMANEELSKISAIARMACLAFESPEVYENHLDDIATLLDSIGKRAAQLLERISGQAESLGCSSLTAKELRRDEAFRAWLGTVGTEGGAK